MSTSDSDAGGAQPGYGSSASPTPFGGGADPGQQGHGPAEGRPQGYGQPAYGQSAQQPYGQPDYGQPDYGQAQYGQPQYGPPQYGAPQYGQPQYGPPAYGQPAPAGWPGGYAPQYLRPTNTMAILALVMAFVFAPAGLILGIIARKQIRQTGEQGDGLALAGIIIGGLFTAFFVLMLLFMVLAFGAATSYAP